MAQKRASILWFLLPVFFSLIGGIIGYFIVRNVKKDEDRANKVFIVGVVVFFISIGIGVATEVTSAIAISPLSLLG